MKRKKISIFILAIIMVASIFLSGCSKASSNSTNNTSSTTATALSEVTVKYDSEDYYTNWKSQSYKTIDLNTDSAAITKSGVYEIKGTLKDGSLIVNVDKSTDTGIVYLILNNASISSSNSAPIYIQNAKKVVLILESGTQNTVYQGSSVVVDASGEPSSAIFSTSDLTITGSGSLTVTSDYNDGITSKDKLKMTDGTLVITAKQDGMVGKDLLAVENGNITITAGKDGMRSTNDTDADMGNIAIKNGIFKITAANDAIQAYAILQIDGGTFTLTSGGGFTSVTSSGNSDGMNIRQGQPTTTAKVETESKKALKGSQKLIINNGTFEISSADDALHSAGQITINGGTFNILSGDDGLHTDTDIKIAAGTITIKNCYEAIEAKNITIDGGNLSLTSTDDGFNVNNAAGLLTINGGEIYINDGGDGVDSNGSIVMTGGKVYVDGPTNNGNGAIDYDSKFTITGGELIASGSSGMAEVPENGTQPSILMYYSSTQAAGTTITLKDSSGNVIISSTPSKVYASVAISSSKLALNTSYTLYKNDTKVVTFKLTNNVTYVNESGITTNQSTQPGGGGGGGRP